MGCYRDRVDELSWTDAWIFASLAGTRARGATARANLIARADMLNHAIPTDAESTGALDRLAARGLVAVRGKTIALTALGRRVQADGLARRGGLFSIVDNMHKALRSPKFRRG
jgi:hypothetical protein